MRHRLSIAVALLALAASAPALAQRASSSGSRDGATFGVGLGLGNISADCDEDADCDAILESAGVDLHAGGMLAPDVALLFEAWGMAHRDDEVTITQAFATGALQFWPVPALWLKGGAGAARGSFEYDTGVFGVGVEDRSDIVPAAMVAAGLELIATPSFAVDVQARAGAGFYGDDEGRVYNLSVGAGMSFY